MIKPYHIIVADDDPDDQMLITQAIKETNKDHRLISVYNGLELMDLLLGRKAYSGKESVRPDLILLDLNMPLLDGFGVLKEIKGNTELKDIPVYVLTTSRFDFDRTKSKELGAHDFYSKPYQYNELKNIVKNICVGLPV